MSSTTLGARDARVVAALYNAYLQRMMVMMMTSTINVTTTLLSANMTMMMDNSSSSSSALLVSALAVMTTSTIASSASNDDVLNITRHAMQSLRSSLSEDEVSASVWSQALRCEAAGAASESASVSPSRWLQSAALQPHTLHYDVQLTAQSAEVSVSVSAAPSPQPTQPPADSQRHDNGNALMRMLPALAEWGLLTVIVLAALGASLRWWWLSRRRSSTNMMNMNKGMQELIPVAAAIASADVVLKMEEAAHGDHHVSHHAHSDNNNNGSNAGASTGLWIFSGRGRGGHASASASSSSAQHSAFALRNEVIDFSLPLSDVRVHRPYERCSSPPLPEEADDDVEDGDAVVAEAYAHHPYDHHHHHSGGDAMMMHTTPSGGDAPPHRSRKMLIDKQKHRHAPTRTPTSP